jgi:hypothetical protein
MEHIKFVLNTPEYVLLREFCYLEQYPKEKFCYLEQYPKEQFCYLDQYPKEQFCYLEQYPKEQFSTESHRKGRTAV